jgi:hypothetical protein
VHIVFNPGKILFSWVAEGEDIRVICKNFILDVIVFRGRAISFAISISNVVLNNFLEVEGVSSSQEYVLDLLLVLIRLPLLVLFAIVPRFVVECLLLGIILCTTLPFCIFKLLALGLLILIDCYLDGRQCYVHCARTAHNLAVDNSLVNFLKQFYVLID